MSLVRTVRCHVRCPPPLCLFGGAYHTAGRNVTDARFWDVFGEHFGTMVGGAQSALEGLHTTTGLSWWAVIATTALALRLAVLPVRLSGLLHQDRVRAASLDLSYQLPAVKERVARRLADNSLSSASALAKYELTRAWLEAMRARGTHPLRSLLPVILHLPLFFTLTAALRKMSAYPWPFSPSTPADELMVAGWETGGLAFFSHLGTPCGWLTLIVFASGVGTIESIFRGAPKQSASASLSTLSSPTVDRTRGGRLWWWRWALHGANVVSVYLLSLLPAAINLFLLTNNLLVMGEGRLLRSRLVRSWVEQRVKVECKRQYEQQRHQHPSQDRGSYRSRLERPEQSRSTR